MSEIEKAKAICARLKGHFTGAKNNLAKQLDALKGPEIIAHAYKEDTSRLEKVEAHFLMEMENLEGVGEEWLSGKFQGIEECDGTLIAIYTSRSRTC